MIRYLVIICLIGYSFSLRLQLYVKTNSFGLLSKTCEKTHSMVTDLETLINSKQVKTSKLTNYKKTNVKLLYNYRNCISALGKKDKINWLANNP